MLAQCAWFCWWLGLPWLRLDSRLRSFPAKGVKVPMRDGVTLTTDIYFPGRNGVVAVGKFPVILERTPYGSHVVEPWAKYFVPQGYIAIGQNVRGRYGSGGHWFPLRDDVNDGYDMAKWLGQQPSFSGKFGTVGTSYPGGTQHALALSNPPYLTTMIPVVDVESRHVQGCDTMGPLNCGSSIGPSASATAPAASTDPVRRGPLSRRQSGHQCGSRQPAQPGSGLCQSAAAAARNVTIETGARLRELANRGDVAWRLRLVLEKLRHRRCE